MAAEPGVPPEQERHEHDQPRGEEEEQSVARGHTVARRRRPRRRILNDRGPACCFRCQWTARHVFSWLYSAFRADGSLDATPLSLPAGRRSRRSSKTFRKNVTATESKIRLTNKPSTLRMEPAMMIL